MLLKALDLIRRLGWGLIDFIYLKYGLSTLQ